MDELDNILKGHGVGEVFRQRHKLRMALDDYIYKHYTPRVVSKSIQRRLKVQRGVDEKENTN